MRSKPLGVSVICVFNGLKVSRFSCSTHVEQRFQPLPSVSQQFPTGRGGETTVSRVELVCSAGGGRLMPRDLSCDLSFPVAGRVEGRCLKMKHRSCLPSRTSKWPEPLFFCLPTMVRLTCCEGEVNHILCIPIGGRRGEDVCGSALCR